MKSNTGDVESRKKFEEEATQRFLNPSATPTWPKGTTADDYESPSEVRARLKKEGKLNAKGK